MRREVGGSKPPNGISNFWSFFSFYSSIMGSSSSSSSSSSSTREEEEFRREYHRNVLRRSFADADVIEAILSLPASVEFHRGVDKKQKTHGFTEDIYVYPEYANVITPEMFRAVILPTVDFVRPVYTLSGETHQHPYIQQQQTANERLMDLFVNFRIFTTGSFRAYQMEEHASYFFDPLELLVAEEIKFRGVNYDDNRSTSRLALVTTRRILAEEAERHGVAAVVVCVAEQMQGTITAYTMCGLLRAIEVEYEEEKEEEEDDDDPDMPDLEEAPLTEAEASAYRQRELMTKGQIEYTRVSETGHTTVQEIKGFKL
jgi:hypothetical protein